jgi:methyl-accepting chemotaxis protein
MLLLLVLTICVSLLRLSDFNDAFDRAANQRVPNMSLAKNWQHNLQDSALKMRNMLILPDRSEIVQQIQLVRDDQTKRAPIVEHLQQSITLSEGKVKLQTALGALQAYTPVEDRYLSLVEAGDLQGARTVLLAQARPMQIQTIDAIAQLADFEEGAVTRSAAAAAAAYRRARVWLLVVGAIGLLTGLLLAAGIARAVSSELGGEPAHTAQVAEQIARGNLDVRAELRSNDTTSVLYTVDAMRSKLEVIVSAVRERATQVMEGTQQISLGNDALNQRTLEQSTALEQTSASMEQMDVTVRANAESARQTGKHTAEVYGQAQAGARVVERAAQAMAEINASSARMSDISGVIDEIAFQSNLLALNASVEAARAGENGRGFAIVAAEVRSLAQRSAESAKEVKALISDSIGKVQTGSRLVLDSGKTLNDILGSVRKVSSMTDDIAAACAQQVSGIGEVSRCVRRMESMTQENAALVEEAASAGKSIEEQARALVQQISFFQTQRAHPLPFVA